MTSLKYTFLIGLSLCITLVIYAPGLNGGFHFDDYPNILNNEPLHIDKLTLPEIWQSTMSGTAGPLKRPISMLSFGINTYFSGTNPYAMKATNLAIHLITGVILILIAQIILNRWKKDGLTKINPEVIAILIGFCWLIHPFNLTGVLYIVQRMTSLASMFAIASIFSYCLLRNSPFTLKRAIIFSGLMGLFGLLGLLSKEIAVLIPFQILVIEICVFRFKYKKTLEKYYLLSFFTLSAALPFIYFLFSFITNFDSYSNAYAYREFNLQERLWTETGIVLWYLKMTLVPNITNMGLLLDTFEISHSFLNPPVTALYTGLLLTLLLVAILSIKKLPYISLGIFWFYISHSLESTVVCLELAFEHRNYLASFSIIIFFIITIMTFLKLGLKRNLAYGLCIAWAFSLTYTTHLRVEHWKNPLTLAIYDAEHHPNSERAHMVLAETYETLYVLEEERNLKQELYMLSLNSLQAAINIDPDSLSPKTGKLLLLARNGEALKKTELVDLFTSLQHGKIDASTVNSLQQLTSCILDNKCIVSINTYISALTNALSNKTIRRLYKSHLLVQYSLYLERVLGKSADAERFLREAIDIYPKNINNYNHLIHNLIGQEKFHEAKKELENYIKNDLSKANLNYTRAWEARLNNYN